MKDRRLLIGIGAVALLFLFVLFFTSGRKRPFKVLSTKEGTQNKISSLSIKQAESPFPYLITPNRYAYIVFTKSKKVLIVRDGRKVVNRRLQRRVWYRVKRYGIEDVACHRTKGWRFMCVYNTGDIKELYLRLGCELLVVAPKPEKTLYPVSALDFVYRWQKAWINIKKDFEAYASLYADDFKSPQGNREKWLSYRRAEDGIAKYVDVVVDNPVLVKVPESDLYAIFFRNTYRSNIKRVDGLRVLVLKVTNAGLKIVSEALI